MWVWGFQVPKCSLNPGSKGCHGCPVAGLIPNPYSVPAAPAAAVPDPPAPIPPAPRVPLGELNTPPLARGPAPVPVLLVVNGPPLASPGDPAPIRPALAAVAGLAGPPHIGGGIIVVGPLVCWFRWRCSPGLMSSSINSRSLTTSSVSDR